MPVDWRPANVFEQVLAYAHEHDDGELFYRTLARTPLYLPGFVPGFAPGFADTDMAAGLTPTQRVLTWPRGGRTYLPVFTSPQALGAALPGRGDGWRGTHLAEVATWLPDSGWGVAVAPYTPISAFLDRNELLAMSEVLAAEPVFHPAGIAEAHMFAGQRTGNPSGYLDALAGVPVLLPTAAPAVPGDLATPGFPWLIRPEGGRPAIAVFTSEQRRVEAPAWAETEYGIATDVTSLAGAWPDRSLPLAVNPGSAIAARFQGTEIVELARWGLDRQ